MIFDAVSHHQSNMLSMNRFKEHMAKHRLVDGIVTPGETETGDFFCFFKNLPTLKDARQQLIREAVKRCDGNKAAAAEILGISPSGISKLLKRIEGV